MLKEKKDKKDKKAEKVNQDEKAAAAPDVEGTTFDNLMALGQIEAISHGGEASDVTPEMVGHKFPLPELPLPPFSNRKERYDPIVDQVTNLMMKHGRLSAAQRVGHGLHFHKERLFESSCRIS